MENRSDLPYGDQPTTTIVANHSWSTYCELYNVRNSSGLPLFASKVQYKPSTAFNMKIKWMWVLSLFRWMWEYLYYWSAHLTHSVWPLCLCDLSGRCTGRWNGRCQLISLALGLCINATSPPLSCNLPKSKMWLDPIFDVAKVSGSRIFMSSKWWKVGWLNIRSKQSCGQSDKVAMGVLLTPRAHCYRILLLGLSQNWAQFSHRKPPPHNQHENCMSSATGSCVLTILDRWVLLYFFLCIVPQFLSTCPLWFW